MSRTIVIVPAPAPETGIRGDLSVLALDDQHRVYRAEESDRQGDSCFVLEPESPFVYVVAFNQRTTEQPDGSRDIEVVVGEPLTLPEPSAGLLLLAGLVLVAGLRWLRR